MHNKYFQIIGEAKIIAIFEVDQYSMNQITSEITMNDFCNLTCTPLTHLESWQKLLGSSSSQFNFPHRLSGNDFLWFEVGYEHGISKEEFDILWERGTRSMIHQLREGQIEIEIFKVLGERRLYGFTSKKTNEDWETQLWSFQAEDKIYKNAKVVDMSEPLQFLLSIEIRNDNHDNGIDVESLIKSASSAIAEKAKYKFRVFGEAKIIASVCLLL
ncbi:unnamed protein product [Mytilus edulis]|uniref:Uncharacterized protein n=1 Tax=Mytilus edulis TaxID=6550 RepID=A0A8S3UYY3_MYTED|nr:unnamed protein product [Mytilus edulis]